MLHELFVHVKCVQRPKKIAELGEKGKKKKGNAWLFPRHCQLLPGAKGTMGDVVFVFFLLSMLLLALISRLASGGFRTGIYGNRRCARNELSLNLPQ